MRSLIRTTHIRVYWTLTVTVKDKKGNPDKNCKVIVFNKSGEVVLKAKTNDSGIIIAELQEYNVDGKNMIVSSPYTVKAGRIKQQVELDKNKEIYFSGSQL